MWFEENVPRSEIHMVNTSNFTLFVPDPYSPCYQTKLIPHNPSCPIPEVTQWHTDMGGTKTQHLEPYSSTVHTPSVKGPWLHWPATHNPGNLWQWKGTQISRVCMQTPEPSLPYRIPGSKDHKSLEKPGRGGAGWEPNQKSICHQLLNTEKLRLDFIRQEYKRPIPDHDKQVLW